MNPLNALVQTSVLSVTKKWMLFILAVGLGLVVYVQWDAFITTAVEWQKMLHSMLANHIRIVSEDAIKHGSALIALSFGYGVFHAVGPGHGKAVIVAYLGTNKESVWKGIVISFSAAILQSLIAILLVSALNRVLKFRFAEVHNYGNDMALVSYVLVIILGMVLLTGGIKRVVSHRRSALNAQRHNHSKTPDHHQQKHTHSSDCGCSHSHVPDQKESIWQTLAVIMSMGFRPCSGALVVLIYAHLVGVYSYGVIATLVMGLGTGLAVSLIAIVTRYARSWLERWVALSAKNSVHHNHSFHHYLRLLGGIVLIMLGWSLYSTASTLGVGHPLF